MGKSNPLSINHVRIKMAYASTLVIILVASEGEPGFTGICVAWLGVFLRAWANGHLKKEETLTDSGPYRFTRNPLYLGNFVMLVGLALATGNLLLTTLLVIFFYIFYMFLIANEEEKLRQLFGEALDDYTTRVPRFWPRLWPAESKNPAGWSFGQYLHNKEWKTALGLLVILGVMDLGEDFINPWLRIHLPLAHDLIELFSGKVRLPF